MALEPQIATLDMAMAPGVRLALLVAPAGWGKTTLLRRWAACQAHPVAWATLAPGDDAVGAFLLACRLLPPLSIARLRVRRQIVELVPTVGFVRP